MEKESQKILEEINETLKKINAREETNEVFSESYKLLERSDARVERATQQIQNTFDRVHDKVFNFNNILIGAYLVAGTFPESSPKLKLWTIIFPIFNLIFLVVIDVYQMEIHRFASNEQKWTNVERAEYGNRIRKQTRLSLMAHFISALCLVYLIMKLV